MYVLSLASNPSGGERLSSSLRGKVRGMAHFIYFFPLLTMMYPSRDSSGNEGEVGGRKKGKEA